MKGLGRVQVQAVFETVEQQAGFVDVVFANAGIGPGGNTCMMLARPGMLSDLDYARSDAVSGVLLTICSMLSIASKSASSLQLWAHTPHEPLSKLPSTAAGQSQYCQQVASWTWTVAIFNF